MTDHFSHNLDNRPLIGILMLETTFPRIPGDIGNPDTFSFPVQYLTVHGASPKKVIIDADIRLVEDFINAGKQLIIQGVKAITTSCGFLALFHRQIIDSLNVPVFTSSLLQVHLAQSIIRGDQKIGIITARLPSLTNVHLANVGIQDYPLAIIGMEDSAEFNSVFIDEKSTLDESKIRLEIQAAANNLVKEHPDVGAIVLECTNMPPYANTVRQETGLPVFDAVSMINYVQQPGDNGNVFLTTKTTTMPVHQTSYHRRKTCRIKSTLNRLVSAIIP